MSLIVGNCSCGSIQNLIWVIGKCYFKNTPGFWDFQVCN